MIIFKENYFEYFNKKLFFLKDEFSKRPGVKERAFCATVSQFKEPFSILC